MSRRMIPNAITIGRLCALPLFLWVYSLQAPGASWPAAIIVLVLALSDVLDGWLARLALNAGMDQPSRQGRSRPLDLSSVTAALQEETDMAATRMTIEQIARAVSLRFGVRVSALRGAGRSASVVEVRHLAMHLARLHTDLSFAAIGAYFGGRDPATVRHACKAASVRLNADPALASAFGTLLQPLQR